MRAPAPTEHFRTAVRTGHERQASASGETRGRGGGKVRLGCLLFCCCCVCVCDSLVVCAQRPKSGQGGGPRQTGGRRGQRAGASVFNIAAWCRCCQKERWSAQAAAAAFRAAIGRARRSRQILANPRPTNELPPAFIALSSSFSPCWKHHHDHHRSAPKSFFGRLPPPWQAPKKWFAKLFET